MQTVDWGKQHLKSTASGRPVKVTHQGSTECGLAIAFLFNTGSAVAALTACKNAYGDFLHTSESIRTLCVVSAKKRAI